MVASGKWARPASTASAFERVTPPRRWPPGIAEQAPYTHKETCHGR
jgi:hypothetical protein